MAYIGEPKSSIAEISYIAILLICIWIGYILITRLDDIGPMETRIERLERLRACKAVHWKLSHLSGKVPDMTGCDDAGN